MLSLAASLQNYFYDRAIAVTTGIWLILGGLLGSVIVVKVMYARANPGRRPSAFVYWFTGIMAVLSLVAMMLLFFGTR